MQDTAVDAEPEVTEEGDFYVHDEGFGRLLCLEVVTEDILSPKLLQVVHQFVSELPIKYSVDICDAVVGLATSDGKSYPRFDIFVEREQLLVYSESRELLDRLGVVVGSESPEDGN